MPKNPSLGCVRLIYHDQKQIETDGSMSEVKSPLAFKFQWVVNPDEVFTKRHLNHLSLGKFLSPETNEASHFIKEFNLL